MYFSYDSSERYMLKKNGQAKMKGQIYGCRRRGRGLWRVADWICGISTRGALEDMISIRKQYDWNILTCWQIKEWTRTVAVVRWLQVFRRFSEKLTEPSPKVTLQRRFRDLEITCRIEYIDPLHSIRTVSKSRSRCIATGCSNQFIDLHVIMRLGLFQTKDAKF